ncbi:reverse transcriptase domain-containing protein [Tanacetum coccineum]
MFRQTMSGLARNWFDRLDPKSVDGFEELSNKFLEEFSQLEKAESAHIKGVPPVLRISAFMHGHGHPELAKKLNDKIPKTVDKMWERVRAFIRGETAADTTEAIRSPQGEKSAEGFTPLTKTPKEILAVDNVNFPPPPPTAGTPEKRNMNKFCDYHQDRGHNTNDCYHLKKQLEEAVASGRLAHLVKDIRQGGQNSKGPAKREEKVIDMLMNCPVVVEVMIEGFRVRRIYVNGGSSSEVMYEHCFRNLSYRTRSRMRESRIPLVGFSREVSYPMRVIDLEDGDEELRSCSLHYSLNDEILNFERDIHSKETLRECRRIKEAQDLSRRARVADPTPMQTSSEVANPRVSLAPVETRSRRPGKEPMQLDDMEERRQLDKGRKPPKSGTEEKIVVNDNYPEQLVTIGGADMTGIPRVITEHNLDTYPHIEPKAQKKRSLALDRMKVVTDEVNEWLKAGIVRQVRYPTWVANPVLVKKVDGSWRMCIDFKYLNKACLKDLYPLPEIDWKIESLMGFQYKCFLDAYKGYHQIQMTKKDEEKTAFHMEEGVFCYKKMPFGLKNAGVTYQTLVDSAFKEQIRVNLEAYMDDMVIKSSTEQDIIKDIEQTFSTFRRINMKLNPKKCSFGMEEGKFLGYIVTSEGIRANPEKAKAVMDMPSPKTLKQMQSLSGKLASLNHFLSKSAERSLPFLDTLKKCTNKKDFRWTEAAEAKIPWGEKLYHDIA